MDSVGIRPAREDDLPALTELYNHYIRETHFTFDIEPWTVEQRRAGWFSKYAETGPHRILVADDAGRVVGMAYSSPFRDKAAYDSSVETSVYCRDGETARGLGRRLYEALFAVLAEEQVHQAFALITLPNEPSVKLHERFGYTLSGVWREVGRKFDRYWDVAQYQRPIRL